MKKITLVLTLFLGWQNAHSQSTWFVEATSFSVYNSDSPQAIEPQITFALDEEWDFHHFSITKSGASSLNGVTVGNFYPYVFTSCSFDLTWYTSFGLSKDINFGKGSCIAYAEFGFYEITPGSWSIGIGAIYSIQIPENVFKNKKRHPS